MHIQCTAARHGTRGGNCRTGFHHLCQLRPMLRSLTHKAARTLVFISSHLDYCNSLLKLAGTTWGAQASTLRTSALALCYSVAEYCCPVWSRSSHVGLVDSQLNNTMRLISGCVRPMQTPWLPVLANIAPPALRRRSSSHTS